MKKLLLVSLFAVIGIVLNAQINIHRSDTILMKESVTLPYDSTDVDIWINPERYIGQKMIYFQKGSPFYVKDYREFDGKKILQFPMFTYFEFMGNNRQEVKLKNIETGEICYYFHTGDGVKPIMAVGYIEKITRSQMNSQWCIDDHNGLFKVVDMWLAEGGIKYKLKSLSDGEEIELGTLYGCRSIKPYLQYVDKFKDEKWVLDSDFHIGIVDSVEVRKGQPYLIFRDDVGNSYDFYLTEPREPSDYFPDGLYFGNLPKFCEADHKKYLKKYGRINWVNIVGGIVSLGMTPEMVKMAYGDPEKIISMTDLSMGMTQWRYANKTVTFVNGKVKDIIDF